MSVAGLFFHYDALHMAAITLPYPSAVNIKRAKGRRRYLRAYRNRGRKSQEKS